MSVPDVEVIHARPDASVVELRGEHDIETSKALGALLLGLAAEKRIVVVDVSAAEFIDSSVMAAIARAHRTGQERGAVVRLQSGTAPIVQRALELGGLERLLGVCRTREEALLPIAIERNGERGGATPQD